MTQASSIKRIGLIKRLVVMIYDGLLLFSLLFFTSALWMLLINILAPDSFYVDASKLDANKLAAFTLTGKIVSFSVVSINILAVSFYFYGWFWTHGGQTLGVRAWNLYLTKPDGKFIDWPLAAKRYGYALISWAALGLGFLWILFNPKRKAWHDLLTDTQIVFHKSANAKTKP